ncbi:hypothetical protein SDC9_150555 [bioreactor metagenome]|uniref:Uncharacterized protein n=1 Tax=bioreactor metagenome TaxID=1076179 RepID=A0A645EMT1_9ZZZZ
MHIVNDIQCINIQLSQPIAEDIKFTDNFIIIQIFTGNRGVFRSYLLAGFLIFTAVNRIEQGLGKISPGSEELHLFTNPHGGYATGNSVIIAVFQTHDIIILILD